MNNTDFSAGPSCCFVYAKSFAPNCLWVLECRRTPTESVVRKNLPLVQNHVYLLRSNKMFRCRIESMRNYHSRLTNLLVTQVFTASLRHSMETEFSLCPHWMRRDVIYLTAIGLTPGGSSTHFTQTIHRTTNYRHKTIHRTTYFTN
jgi:hypothetical protein